MPHWLSDIYNHIGAILTVLGGAGVIAAAVSKLLSDGLLAKYNSKLAEHTEVLKAKLTAQADEHKDALASRADHDRLQLKKREMIFDKELDAVSEFMRLRRAIEPEYSNPDMDWDDVKKQAAFHLDASEKMLNSYIIKHGAILTKIFRDRLKACYELASTYKFEGIEQEEDLAYQARNKAEEMIYSLRAIEEDLIAYVRSWDT